MFCASWGALQLIIFQVEGSMYLESVLCRLFQVVPCSEQVALYRFFLALACSKSFQVVSCSLQVVSSPFLLVAGCSRLFLARCRSFQAVSCSLQLLSSYFLLVIGRFRSILVRYRLFQVVSGRFRSFQVVPRFSKYGVQLVFFSYFKKSDEDS